MTFLEAILTIHKTHPKASVSKMKDRKLGMVAHPHDSSTIPGRGRKMLHVLDQPSLHRELQASWGHIVRAYLKTQTEQDEKKDPNATKRACQHTGHTSRHLGPSTTL